MAELNDILKLSVAEKILAVEKIWESIKSEELPVASSQKEEIKKRLNRYKTGKTKFYSWEEVKAELHPK